MTNDKRMTKAECQNTTRSLPGLHWDFGNWEFFGHLTFVI